MEKITRDHVFPNSWYPDNTPDEVQRLVAPCCNKCNSSLGALEQELFFRLACCIDPAKAEASGINKRLLRSFAIGDVSNLSTSEIKIRRLTLEKIKSEIRQYRPGTKAFPGLGLHKGYPPEVQMTIPVPAKELETVAVKIVRGLEFIYGGKRYIEPPYEAEVYFVEEGASIAEVYNLFKKQGATKKDYGPGFEVERAAATDKSKSVIYRIKIWNTLIIYGSVMTPDPDEMV